MIYYLVNPPRSHYTIGHTNFLSHPPTRHNHPTITLPSSLATVRAVHGNTRGAREVRRIVERLVVDNLVSGGAMIRRYQVGDPSYGAQNI